MSQRPEPTYSDIVRLTRAFLMTVLVADAIALRPDTPRARGPITPLAEKIFRVLVFHFENALTGLCNPSIVILAGTAGASQSQAKVLLRALARTEYLSWKHGKRKRVLTRKGWRVVRSANQYRILCPRRHLAALRRSLVKVFNGRHSLLIGQVIARFTPPTEEAKATEKIVAELAADLRPRAAPATDTASPTRETGPPSQGPPEPSGSVEIGGVQGWGRPGAQKRALKALGGHGAARATRALRRVRSATVWRRETFMAPLLPLSVAYPQTARLYSGRSQMILLIKCGFTMSRKNL